MNRALSLIAQVVFSKLFIIGAFAVTLFSPATFASTPFNSLVIQTIHEIPQGGGYSTARDAFDGLKNRIQIKNDLISVDHLLKGPSFCSGATYIVFLKTLEKLHQKKQINIAPATAKQLLITNDNGTALPDGFGVWGRWNANGPGTAGLMNDLKMGDNFSDDAFRAARPGDFLKIFWTSGRGVGKFERGHSVVFTGVLPRGATGADVKKVCYWSSHGYEDGRESGFGEKCSDRTEIQDMIFSRLQKPKNINQVLQPGYQFENKYLSSLLDVESTIEEARRETNTQVVSP